MKKLILSALLFIGFGVYGFATNKIEVQLKQTQKEEQPETKKKVDRYDYCLFKFMDLLPKKIEKDTTQVSEQLFQRKELTEETTHHQEKPLDFFMFSYAS